ncbi:MAG: RdgB/HAM1 family non-canonical purine NTP pyrophosphatase [Candidatus Sericytochromatia bacterium]
MTVVILASSNAHKLEELQALFGEAGAFSFQLAPRALEVEETGSTFAANAALKAEAYAQAFGLPALADDSGLCVDALDGRPGVHSARYAPTDAERIGKLLGELDGVPAPERTASFVCAMALRFPNGELIQVEGRCPGVIVEAPRGQGGFGYDPVFLVPSLGKTFAELTPAEKNAVSHRAIATSRLRGALAAAKI